MHPVGVLEGDQVLSDVEHGLAQCEVALAAAEFQDAVIERDLPFVEAAAEPGRWATPPGSRCSC